MRALMGGRQTKWRRPQRARPWGKSERNAGNCRGTAEKIKRGGEGCFAPSGPAGEQGASPEMERRARNNKPLAGKKKSIGPLARPCSPRITGDGGTPRGEDSKTKRGSEVERERKAIT